MYTLCHISDVHLAPIPKMALGAFGLKQALGLANWKLRRHKVHDRRTLTRILADAAARGFDHLVVSGDLVNFSHPAEFTQARAWLEGLGAPGAVSVVPGNHDSIVAMPAGHGFETWAPWMTGEGTGAADDGTNVKEAAHRGDRSGAFPFVRHLGDNVALVGLSSSVPTPPFFAAGALGEGQLSRLAGTLAQLRTEGRFRVIVVHHPPLEGQAPQRCALRDAASLEDVVASEGAELILHGHNHRLMQGAADSVCGEVPVLGVSSGSARVGHAGHLAAYRRISFHGRVGDRDAHIAVETRGLSAPDGEIQVLDRQTFPGLKAVTV